MAEFVFQLVVARPFGYIRNHRRNVKHLENEVLNLKTRREMVQFAVDGAMRQGEMITHQVRHWLDRASEVLHMADEVMERYYMLEGRRCCNGLCNNLAKRYQISRKAKMMLENVVELQYMGKFDQVSYRAPLQRNPSIYIRGGYEQFDSRSSILNGILETLRDDDVVIVGVYGMGGTGKTTLVKKVGLVAMEYNLFDVVIFVQVTHTPNIREIHQVIADELGLELNLEESESRRASKLYARLRNVRRVLVILDDLWGSLDLEKVGIPFGCKLLLTSRLKDVLDLMETQRYFCLQILNEEEAFHLFMKTVGDDQELPDQMQSIAIELVRKCAGVPSAIITVAKTLRNKSMVHWKYALQQIKNSAVGKVAGMADIYSSIEFSYNCLNSEELKLMFLLCSFMENTSFEDLVRYGLGFGLFPSIETMEEARDYAAFLVRALEGSSLLFDTPDKERFSMHDLVRDVGRSIASRDRHMFTVTYDFARWVLGNNENFKNCTVISLNDIRVLPDRLEGPQLKIFYLKTSDPFLEVSDDFFGGVPGLKVLHLIGMGLLSLPTSLGGLVNLQTLCMAQCKLRDVAVIGKLTKLEILSFHSSDIEKLPEDIGKLIELRLLDLSHCSKLKVITANVISRLTHLEEMYTGNTTIHWEADSLAELKHLSRLSTLEIHVRIAELMPKDLFSKMLERYKIVIGNDWGNCDLYKKYETARMLKVSAINVEKIWSNQLPAIASFVENLTCLVVHGCGKLRHLFSASMVNSFMQLQYLEICECTVLEEIIVADEVREERENLIFSQLKYLKMNYLESLRQFWSGGYIKFPLLKELEIENCPELEASIFNDKVEFPELERMIISCMDNLKTIWDNQLAEGSFRKLKALEVNDCQKLLTVFPSCICERPLMLDSLTVKSCRLVEQIFDLQDAKYLTEANLLRELYIDNLPNLKHIWNEDPQGLFSFEKFQKVTVFLCPNLKSLFPESAVGSLLELESVQVSDCGVEEIVASGGGEAAGRVILPQLSSLQLHGLPELKTFYSGHTVEGPHLKKLGLHHCDKVKLCISEFLSFYETNEEGQCDISVQRPFFLVGQGFNEVELEELNLSGKAITMTLQNQIPEHFFGSLQTLELNDHKSTVLPFDIQKFYRLEKLSLNCGSYMEIFSGSYEERCSYREVEKQTQIKHIVLSKLYDLKQLWTRDSVVDLNLQKLQILEVRSCFNLINLMPSSASFQNLMTLEVWGCERLTYLVTSSIATSLVHLEKLEVFDCKMMTEVLAREEATIDKIVFPKLKSLSLMFLQSLTSFCSVRYTLEFPSLENVAVNECPKMKIFSAGVVSTPSLQKLEFSVEPSDHFLEGDVNTIIQQYHDKAIAWKNRLQ